MSPNCKFASRTSIAAALSVALLAMQAVSAGAASDAMEATASASGGGPAGFLKKAVFVTTPMWISAILLVTSDIRPVPFPVEPGSGGEPLGPMPPGNVSSHIRWLESELQRAQAAAEAAQHRIRALEAALGHSDQPVLAWFDLIPAQGMLAGIAGAMGLLSVAGPSTFVRCYLAIVGSAVGGLMVGACASYFSGFSGSPFWIDGVRSLLSGQGSIVEYLLWFTLLVLGFLRWLTGWECGLYAVVDEVEMGEGGVVTVLHKPLLSGQQGAGAALPPPPGPPPQARSAV